MKPLSHSFYEDLLVWYRTHQRQLPWRAINQHTPIDPYYVLISEIMLQQTTVPTVIPYFQRFIEKWPTLFDFAEASLNEVYHLWQGLGYYSRARNLHRCAQSIVESHQGKIPEDISILKSLPGIGPYTAAALASIAFGLPVLPVDGNVIRVFARLYNLQTPLPDLKKEVEALAALCVPPCPEEVAQAFMDLGSQICRPRQPNCALCPVKKHCQATAPKDLPRRKEKGEKPTRRGIIYGIFNEVGHLLIHQRPEKGLLGGLMGFPGTAWTLDTSEIGERTAHDHAYKDVRHTFTHFHLELEVIAIPKEALSQVIERQIRLDNIKPLWVAPEDLKLYAFPTVMKKVLGVLMNHPPLKFSQPTELGKS